MRVRYFPRTRCGKSSYQICPGFRLTIRYSTGDLARIEANVTATQKTKASSKKQASATESKGKVAEGVVYKVVAMLSSWQQLTLSVDV